MGAIANAVPTMAKPDYHSDQSDRAVVEPLGFLLLPEFPLYALIPAFESLRVANQNAGRQLFSGHLFSLDGLPVAAGNGMMLVPERAIADVPFFPTVIVCAGNHPLSYAGNRVLSWLRRLERHGARLGAIDTGAFALAAAGLLDGYRATLHWEAIPLFCELFPDVVVHEQLYVVDRNRVTCAGGTAALDMMLHLIEQHHGRDLAQVVANGFVHGRIRGPADEQRFSADDVAGHVDPRLGRVVRAMEANIETPLGRAELAARAGISVRQMERLVRARFADTPMHYYLKLRLQAARNHLFYGEMPIQDIAAVCGFSSPAVLSRTFRAHFGTSPRAFRSQFSGDELRRFHPEIRQQLSL
jgi:AraC family transcriptional regulator, carnitine catabolism transcriptional activator